MDPRCRKGILIGFDEGMKSYRIWDPETGKVVRSRDVSFEKVDDDTGDIFYDEFEASKTEETQNTESPTEPTINQGEDKTPEENVIDSQPVTERTRSSTREKKPVDRYGNWTSYLALKAEIEIENQDDIPFEAIAMQTLEESHLY
ncbi:hypothetical protein MJO29_014223 [Puccinia striiformis f. sp. tritici]|nr:hypothetical protein MJO29_015794 [Puccinia striiformis f. sp. tritici]KAI7939487.1 hypothetical protein MJO29_014223 [Puccinia striiformis f. sp. tritici]